MTAAMTRIAALAAVLLGLVTTTATADEQHACLSKAEQRAAIANGQAVTLAAAIHSARGSVRGRGAREVVKARLCRQDKALVYVLTVLARSGKVVQARVDATDGNWLGGS